MGQVKAKTSGQAQAFVTLTILPGVRGKQVLINSSELLGSFQCHLPQDPFRKSSGLGVGAVMCFSGSILLGQSIPSAGAGGLLLASVAFILWGATRAHFVPCAI